MSVEHAAHRDRLWQAVDSLTKPTRVSVNRDNGTTTHATIPSLLDQADDMLATSAGISQRVNAFDRAPCDLGLLSIRISIVVSTRTSLLSRRLTPAETVPGMVRQLAAHVVTHEPERLAAHIERFSEWARLLTSHLATERHVSAVHLRSSSCPKCSARQSVTVGPDGTLVVMPVLLIDFRDGYVRAATCLACRHAWFRGVELEQLASLLGCPAVA